jgi:hypothetical protein
MSQPINMPALNGDARLKCGGCRWFTVGFKGQTCQKTRLVAEDTRACIEYQPHKASPFAMIEKDKFVAEMRKTMLVWTEETIKKYDLDIRSYKMLSKKTPLSDPMAYVAEDKLAELGCMFDECQAAQERLLDLRYNISDKCVELKSFSEEVQAYLFSQYQDFVQVLKNENERKAFYRAAAPELYRALDKMNNLSSKIELAHECLKSAHWALKGKLEAVNELWKARQAYLTMTGGRSVG